MNTETKFELPKLPLLLGEDNIRDWESQLYDHLAWHGLRHYITQDVPEPAGLAEKEKWRRNRLQTKLILVPSLSKVAQKLEIAGWDRLTEDNPKVIYDLVKKVIPKTSEDAISQLAIEFARLDRTKFTNLEEFQKRAQWLKIRLAQLDIQLPDKFCIIVILHAIKSDYPEWYSFLQYDFEHDRLTWTTLMSQMTAKANQEVTSMGLSAIQRSQKPQSTTSTSAVTPTAPTPTTNAKIDCIPCKRVHNKDWPWCTHCKKHHTGGDDKCWTLHPELRPHKRSQNQSNTNSNSNSTPSEPQKPQASTAALHIRTGLMALDSSDNLNQALNKHQLTKDSIIADSGASSHIFNNLKFFTTYSNLSLPLGISSSNGGDTIATGTGTIAFTALTSTGQRTDFELVNALYSPSAPVNMLSVGQLRDNGIIIDGYTDSLSYKSNRQEIALLEWTHRVAFLRVVPSQLTTTPLAYTAIDYATMHRRLMHASAPRVLIACQKAGIDISRKEAENHHCEPCRLGKSTEIVSRRPPIPAMRPLQRVYIDGLTHTPQGHKGFKYSYHYTCAYSGYHWIQFFKTKSDAIEGVIEWVTAIELQTGLTVQVLHFDGEFDTTQLKAWARLKGIQLEVTVAHTSEQNGRSERAGRTIMEAARTSLIQANLPEFLWPYAEESAVYVINLLPTSSNPNNQSPHERLCQFLNLTDASQPYIRHLRTFGCTAYVHIKAETRVQSQKMAPRAEKGFLVGYEGLHGHIYKVYIPSQHTIVRARDVRFYEQNLNDQNEDLDLDIEYEATFIEPIITDGPTTTIIMHTTTPFKAGATATTTTTSLQAPLEQAIQELILEEDNTLMSSALPTPRHSPAQIPLPMS
jgi:Pol polyprotein